MRGELARGHQVVAALAQHPPERDEPAVEIVLPAGAPLALLQGQGREAMMRGARITGAADFAEALGFAGVLAGPLVRSSYRAGRLYAQAARLRPPVA